jgi:hypothetical protein
MLASGQGMYLLIPNASKKPLLVPGKVVESGAASFAIQFEESSDIHVGLETVAYGDVRGKFFQQGATLTEVRATEPKATYLFLRVGEPVSAEQRQTFRVSVALSDVIAQVGDRKKCQVVDLSPEGLAVITSPGFEMGSMLKVLLTEGDHALLAQARVQTIKVLPTGKVRYGLLVPNNNNAARKTLLRLSMGFQRTQLKRLAGTA